MVVVFWGTERTNRSYQGLVVCTEDVFHLPTETLVSDSHKNCHPSVTSQRLATARRLASSTSPSACCLPFDTSTMRRSGAGGCFSYFEVILSVHRRTVARTYQECVSDIILCNTIDAAQDVPKGTRAPRSLAAASLTTRGAA